MSTATEAPENATRFTSIEIEKIIEPAPDKYTRRIDDDDIDRMAASLEVNGQINPILVRPLTLDDDDPTYEIVAGRTRLSAARKLGWESISAKVEEMTDEDAEVKRVTENLIRSNLRKGELAIALKRWEARVKEIAPHRIGKAASGKAASAKRKQAPARAKRAEKPADDREPEEETVEETAQEEPEKPAEQSLVQEVMDKTGKSRRTVQRELSVSRAFDEDQLEILNVMEVPVASQEKLAMLPDQEARDEAVKQIGLGIDFDEAFKAAKKQANANAVADPDDMDDEEWFTVECGDISARLTTEASRNAYKRDSLLYRRTREARNKVRAKLLKEIEEVVADVPGSQKGRFFRSLLFVCNVRHPKHWLVCSGCNGSGRKAGNRCDECIGDGYKPQMETTKP